MKDVPSDLMSSLTVPVRIVLGVRGAFQVKRTEELARWGKLFEQFNYSPQEFYKLVEKNILQRQVPGARMELSLLQEAGLFSADRLYLTIKRERLVFLLCAAPFGNGFFVSARLLDYRSVANFFDYLVCLHVLTSIAAYAGYQLGWAAGLFIAGLLVTLFWSLFRKACAAGGEWLDQQMAETPFIGPIYESIFRPDTYYRRDTAEMFRAAVHNAMLQSIDEMTTEKGILGLSAEERKPVVSSLYRK